MYFIIYVLINELKNKIKIIQVVKEIKYKGCMLWNELPSMLRLYSSRNYSKKVKIFLMIYDLK